MTDIEVFEDLWKKAWDKAFPPNSSPELVELEQMLLKERWEGLKDLSQEWFLKGVRYEDERRSEKFTELT